MAYPNFVKVLQRLASRTLNTFFGNRSSSSYNTGNSFGHGYNNKRIGFNDKPAEIRAINVGIVKPTRKLWGDDYIKNIKEDEEDYYSD